jgi:hypothetical protein
MKSPTQKFPWGRVVNTHTIGDYEIVEYYSWIYKDGGKTRQTEDATMFHPYHQGKDLCVSYSSLEESMIGMVAWKYEGGNSRAAQYFFRMIGIPEKPCQS